MRALSLALLFAACDASYAVPPTPVGPYRTDICSSQFFRSPSCDLEYDWSPGYYNDLHVWVTPRYAHRTLIVPSYVSRTVITSRPTVVNRTQVVRSSSVRTTVTRPAPSRSTVTTTRRTVTTRRAR